jgi:hypothetical protein
VLGYLAHVKTYYLGEEEIRGYVADFLERHLHTAGRM